MLSFESNLLKYLLFSKLLCRVFSCFCFDLLFVRSHCMYTCYVCVDELDGDVNSECYCNEIDDEVRVR